MVLSNMVTNHVSNFQEGFHWFFLNYIDFAHVHTYTPRPHTQKKTKKNKTKHQNKTKQKPTKNKQTNKTKQTYKNITLLFLIRLVIKLEDFGQFSAGVSEFGNFKVAKREAWIYKYIN